MKNSAICCHGVVYGAILAQVLFNKALLNNLLHILIYETILCTLKGVSFHLIVAERFLSGSKSAKIAVLPRFAQVVQQEISLKTSLYKCPKSKTIFKS